MSGRAVRGDGTLREASELEWQHSASPVPNILPLATHDFRKKKSPKKLTPKKIKSQAHPTRPITSAISQKAASKKLKNLTLQDKILILDYIKEDGKTKSQMQIVDHFKSTFPTISQATISRLKNEEKDLRKRAEDTTQLTYKWARVVQFLVVEAALVKWIMDAQGRNVRITGELIRAKAKRFADLQGVPSETFLTLSNGWLDAFKQRHLLKSYKFHGEAALVEEASVVVARERLQKITEKFSLKDIYNADETGLYYRMPPDRGLATQHMSGLKGDKTQVSILFTANTDGSDRQQPLFIGHAKQPRCFNKKSGKDLGFEYYWNKKAWMTGLVFQSWLEEFNTEMRLQNHNVLMLVDNAPSHVFNADQLSNVTVEFLDPNMTSHIQPMDAGIIACFKAHYRWMYILRALDRDEDGLADLYHIDQLEGMRLAESSWSFITQQTVEHCWLKSGILSNMVTVAAPNAIAGVESAINDLQAAVQALALEHIAPINFPTVEELMQIDGEMQTEVEWTDEDIVEQVWIDGIESAGGTVDELDDLAEDGDEPYMAIGTACESLRLLTRLCQKHPEIQSATSTLNTLRHFFRQEYNKTFVQQDIRDFYA